MAVFLINVCKFDSCGLKFGSLQELIRHIEEYHVDLEPISLDAIGNTTCLPVSCILRLCSNRDESSIDLSSNTQNNNNESHIRKSINSPPVSLSTTPTGSELDGEDADSDSGQSSIDSWATANMNNATNNLLKYHQIMGSTVSTPNLDENNNNNTNSTKFLNGTAAGKEHREFICAISGCTKRYRNSNSLSHHRRSAHRFNNNAIITPKPTADESNAIGNSIQFNCGGFHSSEIISDANCPPVSNNVEIIGETKLPVTPNKCPPMLSAPTLQQHLLSPIIPKVASS
ncbi:Juxtaposed with another zinc finger protein 1 [Blomia tropicalis]|nr:Juxtaposed with another zinc finger protein 1 [Blomia tropicalis]